jgi:phosphopentomutase
LEDHIKRAKDLFTYYCGSHFQMYREGAFVEYKKYDIPKQTEVEWFKELIEKYTAELLIRDWDAVFRLDSISRSYQDSIILGNVISFASRNVMSADSIVKLMYAESIIRIIQSSKKIISKDLLYNACKVAVRLLENIISNQLILDPERDLSQFPQKDKKSLNNRARKGIDEIKSILN